MASFDMRKEYTIPTMSRMTGYPGIDGLGAGVSQRALHSPERLDLR